MGERERRAGYETLPVTGPADQAWATWQHSERYSFLRALARSDAAQFDKALSMIFVQGFAHGWRHAQEQRQLGVAKDPLGPAIGADGFAVDPAPPVAPGAPRPPGAAGDL